MAANFIASPFGQSRHLAVVSHSVSDDWFRDSLFIRFKHGVDFQSKARSQQSQFTGSRN